MPQNLNQPALNNMPNLKSLLEGPIMVFDVESIGLHGEAFAVGFVVMAEGKVTDCGYFACPRGLAEGAESDREWVDENIPKLDVNSPDPFTVREKFWRKWAEWRDMGALLAAECAWPVESRFLNACVDALPNERRFGGPYPMIEISTLMMAAGMDPMANYVRNKYEQPKHCPLADARQSARLMFKAAQKLNAQ